MKMDDSLMDDENDKFELEQGDYEKRKRAPNFSRKELRLLDELIKVYYDQINNKSNSAVSIVIKNRAWKELAKDFNAHMGGEMYRSPNTLKRRYENTKKAWNRKNKMRYLGTSETKGNNGSNDRQISDDEGGDTYRSASNLKIRYENTKRIWNKKNRMRDPGSSKIDENWENDRQTSDDDEDDNQNDDRTHGFIGTSMKMEADNDEDEEGADNAEIKELIRVHITGGQQDNEDINIVQNENDTSERKSGSAKSRKISLTNGTESPFTSNFESLQKQCFMQEHRMKLRQMQEKHNLELECVRAEHKEKLKMMREEHQRRIQLLELEKSVGIMNKL